MSNARLRLAFTGETMHLSCAPFFLTSWGNPTVPTPLPAHDPATGS